MKKRQAWFRWVFSDGYQTIKTGYTPFEMQCEILKHGKCINKVFVSWDDELTGGERNAASFDESH